MENRYFAFIDYLPDAVVVISRNGLIVKANKYAEQLFNYDHGKLQGLSVNALLPQRYRKRHAQYIEAFFATPMVRPLGSGELYGLTSDGHEIPVEIAIGPDADSTSAIAVIHDITERHASRAELRKLKDRLQAERDYLRDEIKYSHNFEDIIGTSDPIRRTLRKVELVAKTNSTVLLLGETGTGKELLARAIHARSERSSHPIIKVDCSALPSGLIESELFGHEKGAFTGAYESRIGRFELAHDSTIFLDEIGELPLDLQSKLLRVLEEGEFQRLGAKQEQKVDVRVIAATNRDLEKEIAAGRFREDLYYRLSVFPIESPPLRERREDIPMLVSFFVTKLAKQSAKRIQSISTESMDVLTAYDWPGNVRELRNVIERSIILCEKETLEIVESLGTVKIPSPASENVLKQGLHAVERSHILRALDASNWKIKGDGNAASQLGLSPSTLRSKMKKLDIQRP